MSRFHTIPPLDFSEYFPTDSEINNFEPNDWIMPFNWISTFIYNHISAHFWGYLKENSDPLDQPRVLQIGCAEGGDAVEIAKFLKLPIINGKLDLIDWFKGNLTVDSSEDWAYNENNVDPWKEHLYKEMKKYHVEDTITIYEGDSRIRIHDVPDNSYDIVFIDGGHEYDIVKSDIEHGYKKLKKNGIMVLDDFDGSEFYKTYDLRNASDEIINKDTYNFENHNIHAGVIKAVEEFFEGNYIEVPSHSKVYHIKDQIIKKI